MFFIFTIFIGCEKSNPELLNLVLEIKKQNNELLNEVKDLKIKSDSLINELTISGTRQDDLLLKVTELQSQMTVMITKIEQLNEQLNAQGANIEIIKSKISNLEDQYKEIIKQLEQLLNLSKLLINKTFIPDDKFESELIRMGLDDVLDDYVITAKIDTVKVLNIGWKGIKSVEGISDFRNLEILVLTSNKLSSLDVSKNLKLRELYINNTLIPTAEYNIIRSINLSQNLELRILNVYDNKLTEINLSQNTKLERLFIGNNHSYEGNQLKNINLQKNTNLKYLQMGMMPISNIDLNSNNLLEELILVSMPLSNINVSGMQNLQKLNVGGTLINTVNLSKNLKLTHFYALFNSDTHLTTLDLSKNINLELLTIRRTALKSLNLTNNLKLKHIGMESTNIDIMSTGLEYIKDLTSIDIRNQKSGEINFSLFTNLSSLALHGTAINSINLEKNTAINYLFLENLPISNLDISNLSNIKAFRAKNMSKLKCIKASTNQITYFNSNSNNWVKDSYTNVQTLCL